MSCPNCKLFHKACQAQCCTAVPMYRTLFNDNFTKIASPVVEILETSSQEIIPLTETGKCPFLNSDFGCNIYNDRPFVCSKFGDETHINMTCAYQTKNGGARTKKEFEKVNKLHRKSVEKFLKK